MPLYDTKGYQAAPSLLKMLGLPELPQNPQGFGEKAVSMLAGLLGFGGSPEESITSLFPGGVGKVAGKKAIPKATREANFKKWFGESKVVDKAGNPKTMYHGTNSREFDAFDTDPTFVTESPKFANWYATQRFGDNRGRIIPLNVSAKNPWDFENPAHLRKAQIEYRKLLKGQGEKKDYIDKAVKGLKEGDWGYIEDANTAGIFDSLGHDGFYVKEWGIKNLGVRDPSQLKSVFNQGTYDPNDPRILYSLLPLLGLQEMTNEE